MASSFAAYIDEAGDDGFTPKSSEWFVLSALITDKADDVTTLKTIIDTTRVKLSKPAKKPMHFRKLKHHQKVPYIAEIAAAEASIAAISVLIHKPSLLEPEKFNQEHRLYHYAVRLLVERISWLCRDSKSTIGDGSVELIFSNRGGMSYAAISSYLKTLIDASKIKLGGIAINDIRIAENVIDPDAVKTYSHGKRMGLQVVDAIASGFYNALESRYGFTEDRYARMLKPVMYSYRGKHRGYGIKFFPPGVSKMFDTDDRLKWVKEGYPK